MSIKLDQTNKTRTKLGALPIERLKATMKEASLLEYIPLDNIEVRKQNDVPHTVPQMLELGTLPGDDGKHLTLVACMRAAGHSTKTDGGIPHIQFFAHGPEGMSDRKPMKAREVSRLDSMNKNFAPTNTNPDILNAAIKYIFLAKGASIAQDVQFSFGFQRALSQACRAYKEAAAKKAKVMLEDTSTSVTLTPAIQSASASSIESVFGESDYEMLFELPDVEYVQTLPSGPAPLDYYADDEISLSTPFASDYSVDNDHLPSGYETPTSNERQAKNALKINQWTSSSADTSYTELSTPPTKRDMEGHRETSNQKDDTESELQAIDAANILVQMSSQAKRIRLSDYQEAEYKTTDVKYDAELKALESSQSKKADETAQERPKKAQAHRKYVQGLAQTQEDTTSQQAWAILDLAFLEERPRKRQKISASEDG